MNYWIKNYILNYELTFLLWVNFWVTGKLWSGDRHTYIQTKTHTHTRPSKIYASPENLTPTLLVVLETFRRSDTHIPRCISWPGRSFRRLPPSWLPSCRPCRRATFSLLVCWEWSCGVKLPGPDRRTWDDNDCWLTEIWSPHLNDWKLVPELLKAGDKGTHVRQNCP